ncbi:YezD family protein [Alicyclobacillus kakegawensis]|uniref:YezD family protein n=1 Tax=Alicyclobacillus kakegawensis TaxID=392012 RepID=UPI0009F88D2C|nr:YezD family protein [Alicyclobacillus kakegawensis]
MAASFHLDDEWKDRIAASLDGMRFGTVEITVHEGRIVQIERRERVRFDASGTTRSPAATTRATAGTRPSRGNSPPP